MLLKPMKSVTATFTQYSGDSSIPVTTQTKVKSIDNFYEESQALGD
jgi:hypothetical protein